MRVPKYVPESPELIQAREWEENTRWQTMHYAALDMEDRRKDNFSWFLDGRRGVPESFSHAYDAEVAA